MSVREYIGARYVPLFADPIEWDNTKTYEPLTIVYYQGNSYTSRQAVPTGIAITNETYWALTGNYNAQVEAYRTEVAQYADEVGEFDTRIDGLEDALPSSAFDSTNTVDARFDVIESNDWVTTARINDEAVTEDKLADDAVTLDKLADNSISTEIFTREAVNTTFNTNTWIEVDDFEEIGNLAITGQVQSCVFDPSSNRLYVAVKTGDTTANILVYSNWTSIENNQNIQPTNTITISNNHCNSMSLYNGILYCSEWDDGKVTLIDTTNNFTASNIDLGFRIRNAIIGSDGRPFVFPMNQSAVYIGSTPFESGLIFDTLYYSAPIPSQMSWAQDIGFFNSSFYYLYSSATDNIGCQNYIGIFSGSPQSSLFVHVDKLAGYELEGITVTNGASYIVEASGKILKSVKLSQVAPQIQENIYWQYIKNTSHLLPYQNRRSNGLPTKQVSNMWYIEIPYEIIEWGWGNRIFNPIVNITIPTINSQKGTVITFALNDVSLAGNPPRFTACGINGTTGWIAPIMVTSEDSNGRFFLVLKLDGIITVNTNGSVSISTPATTTAIPGIYATFKM